MLEQTEVIWEKGECKPGSSSMRVLIPGVACMSMIWVIEGLGVADWVGISIFSVPKV
jgi:hypothetical protein